MWMWSKGAEAGRRPGNAIETGAREHELVRRPGPTPESRAGAGFTLVEALVALVVAGLLMPALSRALGSAWTATRTPMDVVSAVAVARDAGWGATAEALAAARGRGYSVLRSSNDIKILTLPSGLAPAPRGTEARSPNDPEPESKATPAGMKLAIPTSFGAPARTGPPRKLRLTVVTVHTPYGRSLTVDTVRFDDAPS